MIAEVATTTVLPEGIIEAPSEPAALPKPSISLASLKAVAASGEEKKEEGKEPSKKGEALANMLGITLKKKNPSSEG